jgi:D-lactate dehydrogenase (cytochrome)
MLVALNSIRKPAGSLLFNLADDMTVGSAPIDVVNGSSERSPQMDISGKTAIVPISRLDEAILGAKEDIAASGLTAPIVGHVGDGNFHTATQVPPEPDGLQRAWELDKKIVARARALGGSCSGEHGVGIGKREFLKQEHGAEALAVMRSVKQALDPRGILNPGKMFLN